MNLSSSIRAISVFEATKGTLMLLAGFGALSLVHHDVRFAAEAILEHFHLNSALGYPSIFLDAASKLTDSRLWMLASLSIAYSSIRYIEAYGLWFGRRWAEWIAAGSGSIYLPFELYELYQEFDWFTVVAILINVLIVGTMLYALFHKNNAVCLTSTILPGWRQL